MSSVLCHSIFFFFSCFMMCACAHELEASFYNLECVPLSLISQPLLITKFLAIKYFIGIDEHNKVCAYILSK